LPGFGLWDFAHRRKDALAGPFRAGSQAKRRLSGGVKLGEGIQAKRESLALGQDFPPFFIPVFPLVFARFR
jgi:hypothetical protein